MSEFTAQRRRRASSTPVVGHIPKRARQSEPSPPLLPSTPAPPLSPPSPLTPLEEGGPFAEDEIHTAVNFDRPSNVEDEKSDEEGGVEDSGDDRGLKEAPVLGGQRWRRTQENSWLLDYEPPASLRGPNESGKHCLTA
jgi:hypothetical protein